MSWVSTRVPASQELERAILNQDPALDEAPRAPAEPPAPERSILLVSRGELDLENLLRLSEPLARFAQAARDHPGTDGWRRSRARGGAAAELAGHREELVGRRIPARVAAFTSTEPAADLVRLASQQEVDLLLIEGPLEGDVRTVLDEAPSDVALLAGGGSGEEEGAVIVPFGAAEHDWAALELGMWFATARGARLRLLGATADPAGERTRRRPSPRQRLAGRPTTRGRRRRAGPRVGRRGSRRRRGGRVPHDPGSL